MDHFLLLGTVLLAHLLALISPGPDLFMVIRNSLLYSRRTGVFTAFGIGLGLAVHLFYCFAGIAFLISQSALFSNIIQIIGASYLIYMGIGSFFAKTLKIEIQEKKESNQQISTIKAVRIGFLTNLLNPKVTLYFLGIFSFIITPKISNFFIFFISFMIVCTSIFWFTFISVFITQPTIKKLFDKFQNFFNKTFGFILLGIGIKIFLSLLNKI